MTAPARIALGITLFAWLFLALWRQDRAQPALGWWGAWHVAIAAGLAVLGLRGTVPPWLAILLGTVGICLASGLLWAGARRFSGLGVRRPGVVAGALAWLLACLVPAFHEALPLRVALSSGTIAA